ncbi:MAG: COX15/CtaA family protein, partial [Candidatus Zixiibacteriota bacterium]
MPAKNKALTIWLALILLLISLMVVVGGLTRLTHSGLSIVDWRPIMGALPPLSESDWQETFDKYKKFPEYQRRISDMTLADFKSIYWWEYSHRLLGRVIGIAFLIPWLYFWIRKRIPSGYNVKLGALFVFGALQGVLGWFMVQSGLIDNPQVSHYRLAAHLALAFLLFGATLWVILALREVPRSPASTPRIRAVTRGITALISLQVIYGALTAGLKGGYVL